MDNRKGLYVDTFDIDFFYDADQKIYAAVKSYEWHKDCNEDPILKLSAVESHLLKELFT